MDLVNNYIKEIYSKISKGDSTEQSYYSILENFLKEFGLSIGKKTSVTVIPKKTEAGNPDFRIWDGETKITGYIEAKDPFVKNLDDIENSEQIKRYLEAFPNLILTNFIEFRIYRNGSLWDKPIRISDYPTPLKQVKKPAIYNTDDFCKLLDFFFNFITPSINSTKTLAEILANKTSIMRDFVIKPALEKDKENYFYWLYSSFKKHLIEDLKIEDFSDLFSQTFTYGLFIAKYQFETQKTLFGKKVSELPFITKTAYDYIQKSFGLLREIFKVISTQEMPKDLEIIVDDIVDILNNTDIYKILNQSNKTGKRDPIFHLYETFLLKYDKEKKKKLGIYYTPLEVVSYIINSVNEILKDNKLFNASNGLATYETSGNRNPITLLDPAVGTGTFLIYAIQLAMEEAKGISNSKYYLYEFIKNHILKNFYAFEILIAPYVVSHLKTLFTLTDENYDFTSEDNVNIYLTNTLEFSQKITQGFPGFFEQTLVTEQKNAYEVKNNTPILIVVGNPPYSVSSQNKIDVSTQFGKFYESYKENVRKEEKNIQPLSDDYIKFLAFAHYKINQTGKGIVAMITNNSFLDGIIHRDMRKKLLEDFDNIYILNLHGDIKRSKSSKDLKDENVFDITQGVSINIFIRTDRKYINKKIYYQELIGSRKDKYNFLENHNITNTKWIENSTNEPYYFFTIKKFINKELFLKYFPLEKIFENKSSGIKTHRDHFVLEKNEDTLKNRINDFITSDLKYDYYKNKFNLKDSTQWHISESQKKLRAEGFRDELIKPYYYHPFDIRYIYYSKFLIDRPRENLLTSFLKENLGIVLMRKIVKSELWRHALVVNSLVDINFYGFQSYVFPLFIYNNIKIRKPQESILDNNTIDKRSNIKKEIINRLESSYNKEISPSEIFSYIYAVLYSNIYREKYIEFLKIDFPKIPFTKDYDLFIKIFKLGKSLVDLHLLKSNTISKSDIKFEGNKGNGIIQNIYYDESNKRLKINEFQYFTNIDNDVYKYYVGSYQVLYKWLKDKKGQPLKIEDINYFRKIIKVLEETIIIQKEIDGVYPKVEKNLIKFK